MDLQEEQFMDGMWRKAEEKERYGKLAEALVAQDRERPREAVKRPGHGSMPAFFREMIQEVGLFRLYGGMADVLCISLLIAIAAQYLLMRCAAELGVGMDIVVFCASPILYACIFVLFWIKDAQSGVYELQMSCKYTFFHVLAARMLAASLLGLGFNSLYVLVLLTRFEADGVRLMAISVSSLACFSVLLMAGMEKGKHILVAGAVCAGWVAVNAAALFGFARIYGELLRRIPVYLFWGAGLAGMCLYVRQLYFMTTLTFRKEYSDATD